MKRDAAAPADRTRRECVRYGGALLAGGLFAGCTDDEVSPSTATPTDQGSGTQSDGTAGEDGAGYAVSMEPVGTVEFDAVPERWLAYTGDYADMGVALGRGDGLAAIGIHARFGTHYYEKLPGVEVERDDLAELWQDGTGKEQFYELDADVHIVDPNFVTNRPEWSDTDIAEIDDNVAPFFGNTIFSRVYDWHDYRYYSMYEAFEKLAALFRERERYEAFRELHDEVVGDVAARLPAETPDVAVLYPTDVPPESFYPYLIGDGTQSKHNADLRVGDALARHGVTDAQAGGGTIDFETLLEIDPDAIAIRLQGEITDEYFEDEIASHLRDHDVASRLTAVRDDRVVYGGLTYQGPIIHLFQLERAAQRLYPGEFSDEELFDRERVAEVVTDGGER